MLEDDPISPQADLYNIFWLFFKIWKCVLCIQLTLIACQTQKLLLLFYMDIYICNLTHKKKGNMFRGPISANHLMHRTIGRRANICVTSINNEE